MAIIGTHNSLSYLTPTDKRMKLFNFISKCQSKTFEEQIEAGALCFDFRIYYEETNNMLKARYAHGDMDYGLSDLTAKLDKLNSLNNGTIVRLILERDGYEDTFARFCGLYEQTYPNLTFIGGYRKSDWKSLYNFKANDTIPVTQYCGSMAEDARWYEKIIPWFYAKRMNKKNLQNLKDGVNLFDFI